MMTSRDFYSTLLSADLSAEVHEYAKAALDALDAKNNKRATAEKAKRAAENAPFIASLVDYMGAHSVVIASEIASALGVSTSKATALAKSLVADGRATVKDYKVKGKGTVKGYSLTDGRMHAAATVGVELPNA